MTESPWRPLVHVLDIAHAFAQVLVAPRDVVHNQAFNVGRVGENYRVRDVANLVADVVPDCSVSFAAGATADIRDYRVDFSKIERELPGYRPQWTVRRGIEQLWAAYANGGMTPALFETVSWCSIRPCLARDQTYEPGRGVRDEAQCLHSRVQQRSHRRTKHREHT